MAPLEGDKIKAICLGRGAFNPDKKKYCQLYYPYDRHEGTSPIFLSSCPWVIQEHTISSEYFI